jgi:hypothetical protein
VLAFDLTANHVSNDLYYLSLFVLNPSRLSRLRTIQAHLVLDFEDIFSKKV